MRVEVFIDPYSGWSWWTPVLPVEDEPRADQQRTEAVPRPAGQGLVLRLLGRVGAWFGVSEQTPEGAWQRVHVPRRDPWEPGARRHHNTVWHWWCP
jgi:hypothetical protein